MPTTERPAATQSPFIPNTDDDRARILLVHGPPQTTLEVRCSKTRIPVVVWAYSRSDYLDFGFIHIDHSRQAWFKQKLKEPRIFDENRVKTPGEKLRMPNFNFTDEEADALVTALLGFTKAEPGHLKLTGASVEDRYIQEGQRVVRQFNCQGCHIMEGEGGAIQPKVGDWLIKYQNSQENEAFGQEASQPVDEAIVMSFSPPNLIGEGRKVHAQWLFDFLHAPSTIRPWLKTRMPTFNFTAAQSNALVRYFSALDGVDFPFAEMVSDAEIARDYEDGEKLFSVDYFSCGSCHIVGDKMPGGSPADWAPDFVLARDRLKPEWMIDWLMDPEALLPGTKMPGYFEAESFDVAGPDDILGGDETLQIKALRNFILGLGAEKGKTESSARSDDRPDPKQTVVGGRVSRAFTAPGD
ncbi:MAG: c-type cytochrome [Planctomycetes bacterium]|nr:c-type cytochrome [Planctomycetota bacterium]